MSDVTEKLLKALSVIDNSKLLASHMPEGRVWEQSFNPESNLGKIVLGLAVEYYRLQVLTEQISTEMDINKTNQLLIDWEKSVGIPNRCFDGTGDIETRRKNVKMLFSNFGGVQTDADFIRIAELYGYDVDISPGSVRGGFPMEFPLTFFSSSKAAKFSIFVLLDQITGDSYFPLPFPIPFSGGGTTFLQCIFDILASANVKVIITSFDL